LGFQTFAWLETKNKSSLNSAFFTGFHSQMGPWGKHGTFENFPACLRSILNTQPMANLETFLGGYLVGPIKLVSMVSLTIGEFWEITQKHKKSTKYREEAQQEFRHEQNSPEDET